MATHTYNLVIDDSAADLSAEQAAEHLAEIEKLIRQIRSQKGNGLVVVTSLTEV